MTVQDAASAACVEILDPKPRMQVIDCCAAPGGKSFYIAERMENTGHLRSCDIYEHKLDKMIAGASRLGLTNLETCLADASKPQPELCEKMDAVLCDVPCSGLGIIRKKPEIRWKEEAAIAALPAIQQAILQNCASYVKPAGTLVYSTCTILKEENQAIVENFLAQNPSFVLEPFVHPVCGETEGMITLLPHKHQTDGFFIAKLRRKA